jgi:hypothetical protein
MDTDGKSIYDTTPYLKRRFKGIRYGYRPKKLACVDPEWDDDIREGQQPGESIIAEITTYSMPSSTTSVYGKNSEQGISYRIAGEGGYEFSKMDSPCPLSLGELVDFIDGTWVVTDDICGIAIGFNVYNYQILREDGNESSSELIKDVEELRGFTTVHSEYYDQLSSHYDYIFDEWANDMLTELGRPTPAE